MNASLILHVYTVIIILKTCDDVYICAHDARIDLSVERVADFQCKHKGKYTMNVIFNLYMYPLHGKTAVYFTNDVLFSYKCKTPSILKRSGSFCLFFFFLEESEDVQNFKKDDRWTTHDDERQITCIVKRIFKNYFYYSRRRVTLTGAEALWIF